MRCWNMLLLLFGTMTLWGCQHSGRLRLASGTIVTPPIQAESPTEVQEANSTQELKLPSGSTIQVIHSPATPTSPESTQTTYTLAKDSVQSLATSSQTVSLSPTRKPDTTVALHKADLAERRILLYAAIICLVGGIALKALLSSWPGASTTAWVASGILFAAWKFSEVPWWAALVAAGLYLAIAGGYKRGEVDEKKSA
jgi:hypothetical protein